MLLQVRANGNWISMLCDDTEEACRMITNLHRGGTHIDEWHGMPDTQRPSAGDPSGMFQVVAHRRVQE